MAANTTTTPPPSICSGCKEFLKVGNIVENSMQWVEWQPSLSGLVDVVSKNESPVTVVVAKVQEFRNSKLCKGDCIVLLPHVFESMFRMPRIWWSDWCRKSGGYFGSQDTFNAKSQLDGHNMWFRYDVKQTNKKWVDFDKGKDYTWWKTNVFVRWEAATRRTTLLILDPISVLEDQLFKNDDGIVRLVDKESLAKMAETASPYYIPSLFMEAAVHVNDKAVWGIRDLVRQVEIDRERETIHDPASSSLHPGLRHTIHVTEMLDSMMTISLGMLDGHNQFMGDNIIPLDPNEAYQGRPGQLNTTSVDVLNRQVVSRLHNSVIALKTLLHRAQSNQSRLNNEVTLSTHMLSAEIAKAAQVDNSVMKTLGYLGTGFLPATFIAALFSMSFFGTDNNNNWIWHPEMWYYFLITVPVTGLTILYTWYIHPGIQEKRAQRRQRKREEKRKAEEERKAQELAKGKMKLKSTPTINFSAVRSRVATGFSTTLARSKSYVPRPGARKMRDHPVDHALQMLSSKEESSQRTASTGVVVVDEVETQTQPQPQQQQQQHMPMMQQRPQTQPHQVHQQQQTAPDESPGTFEPASPGWPGSPGTADRGFMGSLNAAV